MAGAPGSTLVDELNRLANGGTSYPARNAYLGEAGAAAKWAGTPGFETLEALNAKAALAAGNALGLWGVCNKLASTQGLSPSDALRTITS